ncbi:hypothetical protein BT96DRAFT_1055610, partial [Gymnopus androsaceus JB14]
KVNIISWMGRTALEIMGQAGLGYLFDLLTSKESGHPYSRIIKELFPAMMRMQFWAWNILPFISKIGSSSLCCLILDLLPWKGTHHLCDMANYMYKVGGKVFESKKLALEKGDEAVARQLGRGKRLD